MLRSAAGTGRAPTKSPWQTAFAGARRNGFCRWRSVRTARTARTEKTAKTAKTDRTARTDAMGRTGLASAVCALTRTGTCWSR
ncbi:MAG TPA: hypothetical protein DDW30_07370 [Clostridiales bacterium]|nr:hypothetical protein [Clostridiales bacterium]